MRTHMIARAKSVKELIQNSIRLLMALLMMAGALSVYAYDPTGTTADLSVLGKLIIICTMLVGRIGVVTFSMALLASDEDDEKPKHVDQADVAV